MQADLAALVGSRICHDLISPIGAISNGVEILSLTNNASREEIALIKQSVESATARIRFFRIAYGAGSATQPVPTSEITSILLALGAHGRITYHWGIQSDQMRDTVRCIFLALQAIETALPLGGNIDVVENDSRVKLTATGRRITFDAGTWAGLDGSAKPEPVSSADVQCALLGLSLASTGRNLTVDAQDDHLTIRF